MEGDPVNEASDSIRDDILHSLCKVHCAGKSRAHLHPIQSLLKCTMWIIMKEVCILLPLRRETTAMCALLCQAECLKTYLHIPASGKAWFGQFMLGEIYWGLMNLGGVCKHVGGVHAPASGAVPAGVHRVQNRNV